MRQSPGGKGRTLPEYLDKPEIDALIQAAAHPQAVLLMLMQWRAGLRVSEALAVEVADLKLDSERPTLTVRQANTARTVASRPMLRERCFTGYAVFGKPTGDNTGDR